jgi:hypothetical protein
VLYSYKGSLSTPIKTILLLQNRDILEKLTVNHLPKYFPNYMESECPLCLHEQYQSANWSSYFFTVSFLAYSWTPKMEAMSSSETSNTLRITRPYIPEEGALQVFVSFRHKTHVSDGCDVVILHI